MNLPVDLINLILLLALPLLLLCSALFSGSETALFSLSAHQRVLLVKSNRAGAQAAAELLSHTRSLLVTLLIGNMIVNVLYFTLSTLLMDRLLQSGTIHASAAAGIAMATFLGVILFGEVLPKQIAAQRALALSGWVGLPILAVHKVISPVRITAERLIITPLARIIAPPTKPSELTTDELEAMLSMSRQRGIIDRDEQQLLRHVFELGQIKVRDVMVPRVDILGHDLNDPPSILMQLVRRKRMRFLPVYERSLDQIRGIVLTRDLLLDPPSSRAQLLTRLVPAYFVPEIATADELLKNLRSHGVTFAIVVDEYGGTAGLVTLEDVVEHLIGDIPGAYERRGEARVEQLDRGVYRVDAELAVHDWSEWFGRNPEVSKSASDATTIGGVVLGLLGKIPAQGDSVSLANMVLTVDKVEGRRILSVIVALSGSDTQPASQAEANHE